MDYGTVQLFSTVRDDLSGMKVKVVDKLRSRHEEGVGGVQVEDPATGERYYIESYDLSPVDDEVTVGATVEATIRGTAIAVIDGYVCVEFMEEGDSIPSRARVTLADVRLSETKPEAGQMFRRNGQVFVVVRTAPLSEGGHLEVINVLTGERHGLASVVGAQLIADSERGDR